VASRRYLKDYKISKPDSCCAPPFRRSAHQGMPQHTDLPTHLLVHIYTLFPAQVPRPLGLDQVKIAFKRQALLWHPDRRPRGADAAHWDDAMKKVNLARAILTEAVVQPCWPHGPAPPSQDGGAANNGGQRGRGGSGSNGDYILRVNRFEGTINFRGSERVSSPSDLWRTRSIKLSSRLTARFRSS
jgi:DnaJ-class molecular chaperone